MITFEVHLQSQLGLGLPHSTEPPFLGCRFNEADNRWEWGCHNLDSLVELAKGLGFPVMVRALGNKKYGDLHVLEVRDVEEDES